MNRPVGINETTAEYLDIRTDSFPVHYFQSGYTIFEIFNNINYVPKTH